MNIYDDYAKKDLDLKNYKIRIKNLEEENRKLKEYNGELIEKHKKDIAILCEENRKLKESLDIATKCSSKEEDGIIRLSEENKKLKAELERYKKQYEHSMGED